MGTQYIKCNSTITTVIYNFFLYFCKHVDYWFQQTSYCHGCSTTIRETTKNHIEKLKGRFTNYI